MAPKKLRLDYYFDVTSPYNLFAWTVLRRYQKIWNLDLTLKPVFLGGIMQASGNQPPATLPAKAAFMQLDLPRNVKFFHLAKPFLGMPTNFFGSLQKGILNLQRVLYAVSKDIEGEKK